MPTIATTTVATPFIYPSTKLLQYDVFGLNYLWALVKATTSNTYTVYRSTDGGASWGSYASFVRANIVEVGSILPAGGAPPWFMYFAYRTNESSQDRIYIRKFDLTTGTWGAERLIAVVGNGGVAGAVWQGMDIRVVVTPVSGTFVALAVGTTVGGNRGCAVYGMYEYNYYDDASFQMTQSIFTGSFEWYPEVGSGRIAPSLDLEHNGTGGGGPAGYGVSPHLWLSFGRTSLYAVKMAWTGGGWSGPAAPVLIKSGLTAQDSISARWDGSRWLMAVPNPTAGLTSTVLVCERNQSNSETVERTSPTHPTGVVTSCTISFNSVNGDFRVYAVGTSTNVLYYVDYIRATGLWSAWTSVVATAVLGANNYGVRPGTTGDNKYDVYTAHSGSPNTLTHTQQALTYAPYTPTWVTPANGAAADVGQPLTLDWAFTDPDVADTQGSFAVSRQIGAGALAYWRASDSTWQVGEVQNTSSSTALTLATAWGVHTDAVHTYRVKVWDSGGIASGYSDALAVLPSTPVNPAITAPTTDQVITGSALTLTWTATEQTLRRIWLAPRLLYDLWTRSVSNAWGTLTSGQSWTMSGGAASEYAASGTQGTMTLAGANVQHLGLVPLANTDQSGFVDVTLSATPTVAGITRSIIVRYVDSSNYTEIRLFTSTAGVVSLGTRQVIGGVDAAVDGPAVVAGAVATTQLRVTWIVNGTTLLAKAWPAASPQPPAWLSTLAVTAVTGVSMGVSATRDVGNTNTNPVVSWDNFTVAGRLVYDTGMLALPVERSFTIPYVLADLSTWVVFLQTINLEGLPSEAQFQRFSVDYVEPATPTLVATPQPTLGVIRVVITNPVPGGGQPAVTSNDVYRRVVGDTSTGIRVGLAVANNGTYDDWQAVGSVAYEYRILTKGANGSSIFGAWTA